MHIKKGTSRAAVLFPSARLAVKFPRIRLWTVLFKLYVDMRRGDWNRIRRYWGYPVGARGGTKTLLFEGLVANWVEFRFWQQTRNPFLQPTYFSLFGLFNIQRADEPCLLNADDFGQQLWHLIGNAIMDDSHHFTNPANFCFRGGLRMLDYGSRKTHKVITDHGARIAGCFDPMYSRKAEEEKPRVAREPN